ncbi:soluble quino protein glucose dehydrogenase [Eremomyces bilateralis CBS 781.70]|uniref:Soluble quino protein glucose dehydrogenase n=1 Tax=Eremomyces bilateralis CBS 781.70 TaxID=1392243 RepID=A0A6G1G891_9PEZI|nr:soluble quino protein glucose dehydrogenase [Eremomyces bilateralis CBS 781.70]KAF1814325.1 soluble quino protein glucose dehydrogenase [Eremomyces bilateralis CBS 781.70]
MANTGHSTRTIWLSRHEDGMLFVSRGSGPNIDSEASDPSNGISMIKVFNIKNTTSPYNYSRDGLVVGWGLRNSVGVTEHPVDGGIWSVENSVDNIKRDGRDIHDDNPGEELNYHGSLSGSASQLLGGNHGYPDCFAAWTPSEIPRNTGLKVGSQFAMGDAGGRIDDAACAQRVAPRITFAAHMAPLDIKFDPSGSNAWVTFHGSWNRDQPIGYKLSVVRFNAASGQPTEPSDSRTAAIDIMANSAMDQCPNGCFRPVGLAFDPKGRLFVSSDSTGDIIVVTRRDGAPVGPSTTVTQRSSTAGGAGSTSTQAGLVGRYAPCANNAFAGLAAYCMFVA